jgi:multidrug efflux pump subunit AcrA (membrane-fusion protein)
VSIVQAVAAKGNVATPAELVAQLDVDDRLQAAYQKLVRQRKALDEANAKLEVFQKITRDQTARELKLDMERKRSDVLAMQSALGLEKNKERKLESQIASCKISAGMDGVLVYANDPTRNFLSNRPQIEEGTTVRERQMIVRILDLSRPLHVNTKVRESQIDKIEPKMSARIRVDAIPDRVLNGKVLEVFPLPDSSNYFSGDTKFYTTKVSIEKALPSLLPGMTADVEILVKELDNVLTVPVQAVVYYDDKDHVAIKRGNGGYDWREVTLGAANEKFVEVQEGLTSGEKVAMNPLSRMSEDEKRQKNFGRPSRRAAKPSGKRTRPQH